MKNRTYLVIAGVLMLAAVSAVVFAAHTKPSAVGSASAKGNGSTAPVLHPKGWINTPPLTAASLRDKVVLYDFWTYSCVNCVRTIPYVRSWYDDYKSAGLVVIGVHSPEFDFEKNHANVRKAVKKLGVDYPVALDDNMAIWNQINSSQSWPADYLYDRAGKQVYTTVGEGDYTQTEDEIRKLLGVSSTFPRARVSKAEGGTDGSIDQTNETYNGSERGDDQGYESPQPLNDGPQTFTAPPTLAPNGHALVGKWLVTPQYVQSVAAGSQVELDFQAGTVNLVLDTADGKPAQVQLSVDGKPEPPVEVTAAELYTLVTHQPSGYHLLKVTAGRAGLQVYAFTFGGLTSSVLGNYIALFGAGVASFLAPCLVPLLPAYLGLIVGEAAGAHDIRKAVPATAIFVLGFSAVFAGFGVAAGFVGHSLSPVESTVQRVGGVVVIIFGLAMLGVLRGPLERERRLFTSLPKVTGPARPFIIGVAFGAAWSPCVGPLLGAALVVAARSGQPVRGGLLLLSYAMGIGVPFMIASLGLASSPRLAGWLRRVGPKIERVAGVLLVILGVLLATGVYKGLTGYLAQFTPAVHGL